MDNYLQILGVHDGLLTEGEKSFLDENGYLNLGKVLDQNQVAMIARKVEQLLEEEGDAAGSELMDSPRIKHPKEKGADRLADLVNKGSEFDLFYTTPKVLAAVSHVLRQNMKLSSLNYRAAVPGDGLQKLHVDWEHRIESGQYKVCNSIWLLDDFTKENGSTRLVPGTNHSTQLPQEALEDPMQPHPDEILIEAPAGSVIIFNSHAWHGGTKNKTEKPRRAIHSYFCQREQSQQVDQKRYIKQETRNRLTKAAQYLLAV
ncbi:MAG: phytanoyl-CoA dioxygenase family protein [Cyclobacteriaceae bacterium]